MTRRLIFGIFCPIFWLALLIGGAAAQEARTYIRMEEVEIIGVVEHPEITYIIPKTKVRFTGIPLARSFRLEASGFVQPFSVEDQIKVRLSLEGEMR